MANSIKMTIAKNGVKMYYLDGKRISRDKAIKISKNADNEMLTNALGANIEFKDAQAILVISTVDPLEGGKDREFGWCFTNVVDVVDAAKKVAALFGDRFTGARKAFLLLPGPFTYIYFYELLNYNDANSDATKKVDMRQAFTLGGLFFGVYMIFAFALAFVNFPPELNLIKAVLLSLVAVSSLSTFIFSIYLVFGRKLGLLIDAAAIIGWAQFMDMGVMGVWTLLASIRSYLVGAMILAAIVITVRRRNETSFRAQTEYETRR